MEKEMREYIRSLKPDKLPDWKELLSKGVDIGKATPTGKSRFLETSGYESYYAYKKDCAEKGKIVWQILMGLATLDEELEGIREIEKFSKRTGLEIHTVQAIPSQLICIPREIRDKAPAPTSYVVDKPEDWAAHGEQSDMQIIFEDNCLACPNSLETTINPLSVASPRIGILSQFIWDYPGCEDDIKRYSDVVTSLGIVAAKKDEYIGVDTYLDDGIPAFFMDCMSYVAYAMLSYHIITELCGARQTISYGGLLSESDTRLAIAMACDKLLSTDEWNAMSYINGSTVMQWDHDIQANWGPTVHEMLFEILVERKYKMGLAINPVSITEKIAVPTLQDLLDVFSAGARAEEKAPEWEPFIDFSKLEEIRDDMCDKAKVMYENIINGLKECGIDTDNPLEMLCVLKKFNPMKFEMAFHPSTMNGGSLTAYYPTVIGRQTLAMTNEIIDDLTAKGYKGALNGLKIVIAAGDGHTYGLQLVESVLKSMGANVVNGGLGLTASDMLDLADEEECEYIGISVHNGQGLDYARIITELAKERHRKYNIFMGGKLNAILPGKSEPEDVTELIAETGVYPVDDLEEEIKTLIACREG